MLCPKLVWLRRGHPPRQYLLLNRTRRTALSSVAATNTSPNRPQISPNTSVQQKASMCHRASRCQDERNQSVQCVIQLHCATARQRSSRDGEVLDTRRPSSWFAASCLQTVDVAAADDQVDRSGSKTVVVWLWNRSRDPDRSFRYSGQGREGTSGRRSPPVAGATFCCKVVKSWGEFHRKGIKAAPRPLAGRFDLIIRGLNREAIAIGQTDMVVARLGVP